MRANGVGFEACEVVFEAPLLLVWCRGVKTNKGRAGTSTSVGRQSHAHLHNKGFLISRLLPHLTYCTWFNTWLFVVELAVRRQIVRRQIVSTAFLFRSSKQIRGSSNLFFEGFTPIPTGSKSFGQGTDSRGTDSRGTDSNNFLVAQPRLLPTSKTYLLRGL